MSWYDSYKSAKFLSDEEREFLDKYTESEFHACFTSAFPGVAYGVEYVTILDAVKLMRGDRE